MTKAPSTTAQWQNHPHDAGTAAAMAALVAAEGTTTPLVSRGMVIAGTPDEVVARFTGTVTLDPSSFTELDAVADAFACLDCGPVKGAVRVKVWTEAATGLRLADGDESFGWEREWVVAGTFTGEAEIDEYDEDVVIVTLTPC